MNIKQKEPPPSSLCFCSPKELEDELIRLGVRHFNTRACHEVIRAMRRADAPYIRGRFVRPADAAQWVISRPDFKPWSKKKDNEKQGLFPGPKLTQDEMKMHPLISIR